jgi:hypothetical protein
MQSRFSKAAMHRRVIHFEIALRLLAFQPIQKVMGQQHRVQTKRKRRKAYLKRKQEARRSVRPAPKPKTKKQAAPAE